MLPLSSAAASSASQFGDSCPYAPAFNEILRKRSKKKDLNLCCFCECRTGLTDAFDFTRERFSANFPFISGT